MKDNPLRKLNDLGQSPWLDFLSRSLIRSGELAELVDRWGVRGITSNPAIFETAIAHSDDYDEQIADLASDGFSAAEIYETLVLDDVAAAADVLRGVYDHSGGADGFVSVEVSPHLVDGTAGTVAEAQRFRNRLDRPNVMVKVPATTAGLEAIRELTSGGVNVNVTLLFSLERYERVAEAFAAGLEDALAARRRIDGIASVASFFVSRIDSMVDPLLEARGTGRGAAAHEAQALKGEVAIACARRAYVIFRELSATVRFRSLAEESARPQRLLWASTRNKNPEYSDIKYIEPLIGPDTVTTMPPDTLTAYRDHGDPDVRLTDDPDRAAETLTRLSRTGVDLAAVTDRLLDEGIRKFSDPFDALHKTLEQKASSCLRRSSRRPAP
jgi:transaldolase